MSDKTCEIFSQNSKYGYLNSIIIIIMVTWDLLHGLKDIEYEFRTNTEKKCKSQMEYGKCHLNI